MLLLMKYMKIMEESTDAATVYRKSKDSTAVSRKNGFCIAAGICRDRTYFGRATAGEDGGCRQGTFGKWRRGNPAP